MRRSMILSSIFLVVLLACSDDGPELSGDAGGDAGDARVVDGGDAGSDADATAPADGSVGVDSSAADDASVSGWQDPTLTADADARARSAAYEAQLWAQRDDLEEQIQSQFGARRYSDADARDLTYSSGWGLAAYHTMDELIELTHVMEATDDETHRLHYATLAFDALEILVPSIAEGRGTEGCAASGSLYRCSPGFFRYLDAGHGTGAAGFVMNALYENPALREMYAADLDRWATALVPTLDRHIAITETTEASGAPHMPAKIAAGHLAIGKILGESRYTDAFWRVARVLVASAEANAIDGWVGSDLSHARVSAAVLHLAYREQFRGDAASVVTPAHLRGVGEALEEARASRPYPECFSDSRIGHHGVFVRFSAAVEALVDLEYPLADESPGRHSWGCLAETIAGLSMGHATAISAEDARR